MNQNGTLRNATTAHAELLSATLKNISVTESFKNIRVMYMDNPMKAGS